MDPLTQEANNSTVQVEIFDQAFNLRTDPERGIDPDYVLKLARNTSIRRCASLPGETHTADSEQLAVLAALRIAYECRLLKTKLDGGVSDPSTSSHSSEWGWEEKMPEGEGTETSGAEETAENQFTEEDRQHNRERRQRHYTKRSYEKQLLALVNDESIPAKERRGALLARQVQRLSPTPASEDIACVRILLPALRIRTSHTLCFHPRKSTQIFRYDSARMVVP